MKAVLTLQRALSLHSRWTWNQKEFEVRSHLVWSAVVGALSTERCRASSGSLPHTGRQVETLQPEPPPPRHFRFHPLFVWSAAPGCCYAGWSSGWVAFHNNHGFHKCEMSHSRFVFQTDFHKHSCIVLPASLMCVTTLHHLNQPQN